MKQYIKLFEEFTFEDLDWQDLWEIFTKHLKEIGSHVPHFAIKSVKPHKEKDYSGPSAMVDINGKEYEISLWDQEDPKELFIWNWDTDNTGGNIKGGDTPGFHGTVDDIVNEIL